MFVLFYLTLQTDELAAYRFCFELTHRGHTTDATYAAAQTILGIFLKI
jgi:hypothetical protein